MTRLLSLLCHIVCVSCSVCFKQLLSLRKSHSFNDFYALKNFFIFPFLCYIIPNVHKLWQMYETVMALFGSLCGWLQILRPQFRLCSVSTTFDDLYFPRNVAILTIFCISEFTEQLWFVHCSVVLTRVVSLTMFHHHCRHRLYLLFSRLCSELAPLSGCRHGVTGRDPHRPMIMSRLMVRLLMQMMSKGNQLLLLLHAFTSHIVAAI